MRNPRHARYAGPLRAAVLDWAGTAVDFGSQAPVQAFQSVFLGHGVEVTAGEVRAFMGLHKREHLHRLLATARVAEAWRQVHGRPPTADDEGALFAEFVPAQLMVLAETAQVIPGVLESIRWMRSRRMRIGSTTGYTAELLAVVAGEAARQGYVPDAVASVSDVPAGRPAPWMMHRVLERLDIHPPASVVKFGDTPADIGEGLAAGTWTVGLINCGNEVGLSQAAWEALDPADRVERTLAGRRRLEAAGAHYVVPDWSAVPGILDDIEARLRSEDAP